MRIPRSNVFLDHKTVEEIRTLHAYLTFLWLYKCSSFRKQSSIDGQDGKRLSWKTGKLQYCASLEISLFNSTAGGNGPFVSATLSRACWACSMQALGLKYSTPTLPVSTKFMLCVSNQGYVDLDHIR